MSLKPIIEFLGCATPEAWLQRALTELPTLLIDHAHCEKKAAATALKLMYRYPEREQLQWQLSRLAREELRHFEQVMELMKARGISLRALPPSRYAKGLRQHIRKNDPDQLVDLLIIGAFIEARSCERFSALANAVPDAELSRYYRFLLRSESRHFHHYLEMAQSYSATDIQARVQTFRDIENALILSPDLSFSFHSGSPY